MFHELVCLTINDTSRSFALALLICLGAALFPHCVLFDIAAKIAKKNSLFESNGAKTERENVQ